MTDELQPVDEPAGAVQLLSRIYHESDLKLDGGPKYYVEDAVRTALNVVLVELEELQADVQAKNARLESLGATLRGLIHESDVHRCQEHERGELVCASLCSAWIKKIRDAVS